MLNKVRLFHLVRILTSSTTYNLIKKNDKCLLPIQKKTHTNECDDEKEKPTRIAKKNVFKIEYQTEFVRKFENFNSYIKPKTNKKTYIVKFVFTKRKQTHTILGKLKP